MSAILSSPAALLQLLIFLALVVALFVPGSLIAGRAAWLPRTVEGSVEGAVTGMALAVFLAFAGTYFHVAVFWPVWIGLLAAIVVLRRKYNDQSAAEASAVAPETRWLIAILAVVAVTRFAVTLGHVLPPGWDPAFHMLLAEKIRLARTMIFDWAPFEPIACNYPLGSHCLIVQISRASGLPLYTTFKWLIAALGVVTTAQIYAFASLSAGRRDIALYAAAAYGLLALYGSIDYYSWGGLPNLLAMCFLMQILIALAAPARSRWLIALWFAALCITHHHVMLVTLAVFVAVLAAFWLTRQRERALDLVLGGLLGALLAGFYLVPYAARAATLGRTGVLTFDEYFFTPGLIVHSLGGPFLFFSLIGLVLLLFQRNRSGHRAVFWSSALVLVSCFIFFEYIYRAISMRLWGQEYVAFTPSRFLTDLSYFLAVPAGYAACWLANRLRLGTATVLLAIALLGLFNRPRWRAMGEPTLAPGLWDAYAWVRKNAPPRTLVAADNPWTAYLTWRPATSTPIPISEPVNARFLSEAILSGDAGRDWKVWIVENERELSARPHEILWRDPSGIVVAELTGN